MIHFVDAAAPFPACVDEDFRQTRMLDIPSPLTGCPILSRSLHCACTRCQSISQATWSTSAGSHREQTVGWNTPTNWHAFPSNRVACFVVTMYSSLSSFSLVIVAVQSSAVDRPTRSISACILRRQRKETFSSTSRHGGGNGCSARRRRQGSAGPQDRAADEPAWARPGSWLNRPPGHAHSRINGHEQRVCP